MESTKQEIKLIVQRIADILLINGGFLNNPGLYSGETGLILFFARYARYTQNDLYLDYAYDLMKNIQNSIHQDTSLNFKQGLTGIGAAIEYLVQNSFFEADTDEILEDFDRQIFFTYNLPFLTTDLIQDIGYYAIWRMTGNSSKKNIIRQTILTQIEDIMHDHPVMPERLPFCRNSKTVYLSEKSYSHCLELIAKNNFWGGMDMGLQHGLAGWGMSLLTEIDGDDSWISLLPNIYFTI